MILDVDNSKAELFNHYFYSVFSHSSSPMPSHDLPPPDNPLNSINFTMQEVFDALIDLNPHKVRGIDNIPLTVLKHCA